MSSAARNFWREEIKFYFKKREGVFGGDEDALSFALPVHVRHSRVRERTLKTLEGWKRMKKDFMFTNKEHTLKGIMATILGVISLASLVYIIIDSYTRAGEIPLQYGAVAFLTMIFAFVGIVLGVMSKSEKDKFYFFSYLGIVLNVLVLAALSVILYAGAYA